VQKVGSADGALVSLIGVDKEQDVYDTVVDAVEGLLPGSMVIASALEPSGDSFRVVAFAGLSGHIQTAVKLLGVDPTALSYSMDDMRPEDLSSYRSGRLERVPGGFHTLALGKLPRPACSALERALGIGDVFAIGFAWDDFHYGGVSIGLPRGARLAHAERIEVLVHQATIAIRRIRAERELQERTAELDVFFTESVDLLAVADMGGYFRRVNPQWEETTGYTIEELTTKPFLDFVHPDDVESTLAAMNRLADGQSELRFVNRYRTKAGDFRWLEWRAFPRGEVIYAAARDLTERIEAERAVKASEERYRLMADNTADVIWVLDVAEMRFTYVSQSVERLRGYTAQEVVKQPLDQVLTPESAARVAAVLPRAIEALERGDESARINVTQVDQPCKDGSVVATEATTTLLTDAEGRVDRVLGVSRDITERRRAEAEIRALNESLEARVRERTAQLEEAISELEAFSYSVSHDLRAPLRAINGYATILAEDHGGDIGRDGMRCCDSIIGNTRRMGRLIDDLLAFSRLGRSRLAREPVDMASLARSAFGDVTNDVQRGRVSLSIGELPPVTGDPTLLRQIWSNLLSNALKFTAGEPQPGIAIDGRRSDGEIVFSVSDNGPGFDMRHAGKLFQVFERLHGAEYEGSGVGLAIVRRAVEAHGGRIWAESSPGQGAVFLFALPAGPAERGPA
jgi:PAS domain S-box-containing protein